MPKTRFLVYFLLFLLLSNLVAFFQVHKVTGGDLQPSSTPIIREKTFPSLYFMGEPAGDNVTLRYVFLDNGFWNVTFLLSNRNYTLEFPLDKLELNVALYSNATHIAYYFNGTAGGTTYSFWVYFNFAVHQSKVKITITGNASKPTTLQIKMNPKNTKYYNEALHQFWSCVLDNNGKLLEGVGFDWSDVKGITWSFDNEKNILTFNVTENFSIDPSVVGTSSTEYATSHPFQRKSFYANGRFWVFYSDGTDMVYRTSTDGTSWTDATTVASASAGSYFSIWFDGTYIHYARTLSGLYYRRGTPNSDGSITWSAPGQNVPTTLGSPTQPFVSVDSDGYAWISYRDQEGLNVYPYVTKSGNNDGTWGDTPSGFPYQLSTTASIEWSASVIPLTAGKMLVLYANAGDTVKARAWNGSNWLSEVSTSSSIDSGRDHSEAVQGDDVHLTFLTSANDIVYTKYIYSSNSFTSETTLVSGATDTSAPVISRDPSTNYLYVFATTKTTDSPSGWTEDHIYYNKYDGASWSGWTDWIDETTEGLADSDRLTCFYEADGNYVGLVYVTKVVSPYNVKFAYLTITTNVIGTSTDYYAVSFPPQRKSFYANGRFWVFYGNGTDMICATSTDGTSWTLNTVRSIVGNAYFSVWFDGTYLHYVARADYTLYYRRGTPNADGTITWSTSEQTVDVGSENDYYDLPSISVDSNGYAFIGARYCNTSGNYPSVLRNSFNNGSWQTAEEHILSSTDGYWIVEPVPLTNGKMYVVYCANGLFPRGKLWSGSWGTEETDLSDYAIQNGYSFTAVAEGDDVHFIYNRNETNQFRYNKRTYGVGWGTNDVLVQDNLETESSPALSIDTSTGNLYCFWVKTDTDHVYYKKCVDGTWDANPTDWIDESTDEIPFGASLNSFYKSYEGYVGLAYCTKTSSPYNVKFNYLSIAPPPVPEYDYVDVQSNVDGVDDIGTHSNFTAQKHTDGVYDVLTEESVSEVSDSTEDYVDQQSNVDGQPDKGTHSNFTELQYTNGQFDTLTEESVSTTQTSAFYAVTASTTEITGAPDGNYATIGKGATCEVTDYEGGTGTILQVYFNITYYGTVSGTLAWAYQLDGGGWIKIEDLPEGGSSGSPLTRTYNATNLRPSWTWENLNTTDIQFQNNDDKGPENAYVDAIYVTVVYSVPNYRLDLEAQWTNVNYTKNNEYLCIKTGTLDAETLKVDVWDGAEWVNVISSLTANAWNNVSVSTWLTSSTFTIRFVDGTQTGDETQSSWDVDSVLLHTYISVEVYRLELEEQFQNCNYTRSNEELCIKMGSFSDAETLSVEWWNSTSSSWQTIISSLTANAWNNVSVTDYLTASTFTIRFVAGEEAVDATQSTWQKESCLLHTWEAVVPVTVRVSEQTLSIKIIPIRQSILKRASILPVSPLLNLIRIFTGFRVNKQPMTVLTQIVKVFTSLRIVTQPFQISFIPKTLKAFTRQTSMLLSILKSATRLSSIQRFSPSPAVVSALPFRLLTSIKPVEQTLSTLIYPVRRQTLARKNFQLFTIEPLSFKFLQLLRTSPQALNIYGKAFRTVHVTRIFGYPLSLVATPLRTLSFLRIIIQPSITSIFTLRNVAFLRSFSQIIGVPTQTLRTIQQARIVVAFTTLTTATTTIKTQFRLAFNTVSLSASTYRLQFLARTILEATPLHIMTARFFTGYRLTKFSMTANTLTLRSLAITRSIQQLLYFSSTVLRTPTFTRLTPQQIFTTTATSRTLTQLRMSQITVWLSHQTFVSIVTAVKIRIAIQTILPKMNVFRTLTQQRISLQPLQTSIFALRTLLLRRTLFQHISVSLLTVRTETLKRLNLQSQPLKTEAIRKLSYFRMLSQPLATLFYAYRTLTIFRITNQPVTFFSFSKRITTNTRVFETAFPLASLTSRIQTLHRSSAQPLPSLSQVFRKLNVTRTNKQEITFLTLTFRTVQLLRALTQQTKTIPYVSRTLIQQRVTLQKNSLFTFPYSFLTLPRLSIQPLTPSTYASRTLSQQRTTLQKNTLFTLAYSFSKFPRLSIQPLTFSTFSQRIQTSPRTVVQLLQTSASAFRTVAYTRFTQLPFTLSHFIVREIITAIRVRFVFQSTLLQTTIYRSLIQKRRTIQPIQPLLLISRRLTFPRTVIQQSLTSAFPFKVLLSVRKVQTAFPISILIVRTQTLQRVYLQTMLPVAQALRTLTQTRVAMQLLTMKTLTIRHLTLERLLLQTTVTVGKPFRSLALNRLASVMLIPSTFNFRVSTIFRVTEQPTPFSAFATRISQLFRISAQSASVIPFAYRISQIFRTSEQPTSIMPFTSRMSQVFRISTQPISVIPLAYRISQVFRTSPQATSTVAFASRLVYGRRLLTQQTETVMYGYRTQTITRVYTQKNPLMTMVYRILRFSRSTEQPLTLQLLTYRIQKSPRIVSQPIQYTVFSIRTLLYLRTTIAPLSFLHEVFTSIIPVIKVRIVMQTLPFSLQSFRTIAYQRTIHFPFTTKLLVVRIRTVPRAVSLPFSFSTFIVKRFTAVRITFQPLQSLTTTLRRTLYLRTTIQPISIQLLIARIKIPYVVPLPPPPPPPPPIIPPKLYSLVVHVVDLFGQNAPGLTVKIIRIIDEKEQLVAELTTGAEGTTDAVELPKGTYRIEVYKDNVFQLSKTVTLTEPSVVRIQIGIPVVLTFPVLLLMSLAILILLLCIFYVILRRRRR